MNVLFNAYLFPEGIKVENSALAQHSTLSKESGNTLLIGNSTSIVLSNAKHLITVQTFTESPAPIIIFKCIIFKSIHLKNLNIVKVKIYCIISNGKSEWKVTTEK